jgi:hypothetical protein
LYNKENRSGTITYSDKNYLVNGTAVVIGFIVALKRLWWGLYLGKRSYCEYRLPYRAKERVVQNLH